MEMLNWLPVGSIVKLQGHEEEILIIERGYLIPNEDGFVYFDYYGSTVKTGGYKADTFLFNHEDIEVIHFRGWDFDRQKQQEQQFVENVIHQGIQKASILKEKVQVRQGF